MPSHHTAARTAAPHPALLVPSGTLSDDPGSVPRHDCETRMLHLLAWPPLTRMPVHEQATAARLCALLARRPTAGSLAPVLLGRPRAEVFALVDALHQSGHLRVGHEPAAHEAIHGPATETGATPAPHAFFGALWRRLGFHH